MGGGPAPALTVQVVARDMAAWLPATLDSLRAQTRTDFEIVAVDDGSTDATGELFEAAAADLPLHRIRTAGVGLGAARNIALEASRAPLVAMLDGDDAWLPWYVERAVAAFETSPSAAIYSPEMFLAVEDEVTTERYYADGSPLRWFDADQAAAVLHMNFIVPMSTVRREVFESVGGFDAAALAAPDWDLWIRALAAGFTAVHDPTPCGIYRLRGSSLVGSRTTLLESRIAVLELAEQRYAGSRLGGIARKERRIQEGQLAIVEAKTALADIRGGRSSARRRCLRVVTSAGLAPRQRALWLAAATAPAAASRHFGRRGQDMSASEVRRLRE